MVLVPLYSQLSPEALSYILRESKHTFLFTNKKQYKRQIKYYDFKQSISLIYENDIYISANMKVIVCDQDEVVNQILDIAPACLKLIVATNYSNPKVIKKYKTKKIISTQIKDATLNRAESMGIHIVKFGDIERFGMFGGTEDEMNPEERTQRVKEMVTVACRVHYIAFYTVCMLMNYYTIVLN